MAVPEISLNFAAGITKRILKDMKIESFLLAAALVLLGTSEVQAKNQNGIHVKGCVCEAGTEEALGWATVVFKGGDDKLAAGTSCGEDGRFSVDLAPGTYRLTVSFIGYRDCTREVSVSSANADMGKIELERETDQLKGAVVTSREKLIEMKMDKLVMNLGQSAFAQGSNAMELIRKAPGVTIDKDGNIKLNGKSVSVWIDGRPSYLDGKALESLLKGTNGDSIDKFEIMEHPSSKYDAAGQGGIINIKTKKNMLSGLNGNLGADGGGMYFKEFGKFLWQGSGWGNLNFRTGKTNTFLNLSGGHFRNGLDMDIANEIERADGSVYRQNSLSRLKTWYGYCDFKLGNDWFIDSRNTFGVILRVPASWSSMESGRDMNRTVQALDGVPFDQSEAILETPGSQKQANANLNYTHVFDEERNAELTANLDYYRNNGKSSNIQSTYSRPDGDSDWTESRRDIVSDNIIDIYSAKTDYQTVLWKCAMLETGAKWAMSDTRNGMTRTETGMEQQDTKFSYREHIAAVYASLAAQLGAKWSVKFGLRGEYTNSFGDWISQGTQTRRSYFDVFPTAFVGFNPSEKWRLSASYTRRITRPGYYQLNPVETYVDAHNGTVGNPDIQPEYNDGAAFQCGFGQYLSLSLGYDFTNRMISQTPQFKDNGDELLVWSNFGKRHMASASFSVSELPVAKWLTWTLNLTGLYTKHIGTLNGYVNGKPFFSAYSCFTFIIPKDWKIQLDGYYSSPFTWGNLISRHQYALNLAVKKNLLDNRLNLTLKADDLLRSMSTCLDMAGVPGVRSSIGQKYYGQSVRLGITWNFGTAQSGRARNVGNMEEMGRVSGKTLGK